VAFAKMTPVSPPIVNKDKKPRTNKVGVVYLSDPPYAVANHEN